MKRKETTAEATDPSTVTSTRITKNVSICEAKTFWQNQRKKGNIDAVFKEVQSKLQLLWQKIKDGSATNQDYVRALVLVNAADLEHYETYHHDPNFVEELSEDKDCPPVRTEEPSPIPINYEIKETLPSSEPESSDVPLPSVTSIQYENHSCGQTCLSIVNPFFSKRENPLKFPVICHFERRHAKSGLISRQLDVIYKAPCGKCLRDFDDVCSYLFQTKCRFLSPDHFSFNTYLQLDRNIVKNQVVFEEADISKEAELLPVPLCNEVDNSRPDPFTYRNSPWPRGYSINNFTDLFVGCCDCTDGCLDVSTCACLQLTARELGKDVTLTKRAKDPGYKYKRLQSPVLTGLYECNVSCNCERKMCQNRVVQHGLQVRLQVFKTKGKGWGVRCLDDLDRGTFVCIYAGRILMKTVDVNIGQDSMMQTPTKKTASICPTKKRRCSHSDSEIAASPSASSFSQKFRITPLLRGRSQTELKSRTSVCHVKGEKLDFACIKRPKTKTSILQKRRRQLMEEGTVTMLHSSDDELITPPISPKKQNPGTADRAGAGCQTRTDLLLMTYPEDRSSVVFGLDNIFNSLTFTEKGDREEADKNVKVIHTTRGKSALNDEAGYVSDESGSSVLCNSKENLETPDSNTEENVYFIDASTEGNVGRFLNHSCSPNLFVQHVFVETHSKKFPWVAFFTKSFIKAGTELTWEYNYDIGSVPEKEISCLCGHKTCKNVII